MDEQEKTLIALVATDKIYIPVSSMDGKLKRSREKLAEAIGLYKPGDSFAGERVYARVEESEQMKARGMSEGIEVFASQYPRHGKILKGLIEEQRAKREVRMCFGVNHGCRLSEDNYMSVMEGLGFSEAAVRGLYPELMNISRNLARKRQEERSILVG